MLCLAKINCFHIQNSEINYSQANNLWYSKGHITDSVGGRNNTLFHILTLFFFFFNNVSSFAGAKYVMR